jgi:hypothetical protein
LGFGLGPKISYTSNFLILTDFQYNSSRIILRQTRTRPHSYTHSHQVFIYVRYYIIRENEGSVKYTKKK